MSVPAWYLENLEFKRANAEIADIALKAWKRSNTLLDQAQSDLAALKSATGIDDLTKLAQRPEARAIEAKIKEFQIAKIQAQALESYAHQSEAIRLDCLLYGMRAHQIDRIPEEWNR